MTSVLYRSSGNGLVTKVRGDLTGYGITSVMRERAHGGLDVNLLGDRGVCDSTLRRLGASALRGLAGRLPGGPHPEGLALLGESRAGPGRGCRLPGGAPCLQEAGFEHLAGSGGGGHRWRVTGVPKHCPVI